MERPTTNSKLAYQIRDQGKLNIYKLFDKLWHWKLRKVTGNSTLRTYEKFGNTLLDGFGGGGGRGMVCSYFSEERRLFSNFVQKNYYKILLTVIMTKTVLRSPVNR